MKFYTFARIVVGIFVCILGFLPLFVNTLYYFKAKGIEDFISLPMFFVALALFGCYIIFGLRLKS